MHQKSLALEKAARALAIAPSAELLREARSAWKGAALAWKRVSVLPSGLLGSGAALAEAYSFPARAPALEVLVADERATSADDVRKLSADAKGVFALEWLLFDRKGSASTPAPARVNGPSGDRARHLALALATELSRLGGQVTSQLRDGGEHSAQAFAANGQESLDRLVNQMVEASETLVDKRLSLILWMDQVQRLQPGDVEGYASGTSHELSLALVLALESLYRGGLITLAEASAPAIARNVGRAFDGAVRNLRELGAPLEDVVRSERSRFQAAFDATKALEVALKAELSSALGVTLTTQSTDGD